MRRRILTLGLAVLALSFFACADSSDQDTLVSPDDVVAAKGGTKGKPDKNNEEDNTGPYSEIEVTGFTIDQVAAAGQRPSPNAELNAFLDQIEEEEGLAENFFGCPDPLLTCNKLTLEYTGTAADGWLAGGQLLDVTYVDSDGEERQLAGPGYWIIPGGIPLDGTSPLVLYWQGQLAVTEWDADTETELLEYFVVPDLVPFDAVDRFGFVLNYQSGKNTWRRHPLKELDLAVFQGPDAAGYVAPTIDQETIAEVTYGKGKKATTVPRLQYQIWSSPTGVSDVNVRADYDIIMTRPDDTQAREWASYDENNRYKFVSEDLTQAGCYTFDVVGVGVVDFAYPAYVWDGDASGLTIYAVVDEQGNATTNRSGCSSS